MKAAEMGNSRSMGKLANAYFSGRGVPEDYYQCVFDIFDEIIA